MGNTGPCPHCGRVSTLYELERDALETTLKENDGDLAKTAQALGIGRSTLYRKIKAFNINPENFRGK